MLFGSSFVSHCAFRSKFSQFRFPVYTKISRPLHTYFHRKKGILTLVRMGGNLKNNRDRYRHVYIFLIRKKKENLFEKCLSVRPCAKVMHTQTQEREEIIECGFLCLKGVYWESKLRKFRVERSEIFNGFAISQEPFDNIESNSFYFED